MLWKWWGAARPARSAVRLRDDVWHRDVVDGVYLPNMGDFCRQLAVWRHLTPEVERTSPNLPARPSHLPLREHGLSLGPSIRRAARWRCGWCVVPLPSMRISPFRG